MGKTKNEAGEAELTRPAEIVREYGPFPGAPRVNGVTWDGTHVWFASGEKLQAFLSVELEHLPLGGIGMRWRLH